MTEDWQVDRELKLWILAVVALGGGAFAAAVLVPKVEGLFAAGAGLPRLTHAVVASADVVWMLPVLALFGYLLRRRQVGTAKVHAASARSLLAIGAVWLLVAVCGLFWPLLGSP